LRESRILVQMRVAAHERPNFDGDARLGLFVDQPARGEDGVVEVRRKINPSHGVI